MFEKIKSILRSISRALLTEEIMERKQYRQYTMELEKTLRILEANLHDSDDPYEIAERTMKTTCEFYGGDWCGIFEVDTELEVWTPLIWYNPYSNDNTTQYAKEFESLDGMQTWIESMRENKPIIIPDVETVRESAPFEYSVYKRLACNGLVAVPFKPRPVGFLVVRNPSRYAHLTSMLQNLAYVTLNAINQKRMMQSVEASFAPEEIKSDKDIIINLFDTLEIYTEKGVLYEHDFKSPKICRLLTYLILNRRTIHPPLNIVEALWPEEDSDPDAQINSLRGLVYRFRQSFALISEYRLIETTPTGYRINPELNIITDLQQFDKVWDTVQTIQKPTEKVDMLRRAVDLYRGPVFKRASSEPWLVNTATHYSLRYVGIVNELLACFASMDAYHHIHQYATLSLDVMPGNLKARYWLIYSMYKMSTIDLANAEIERAKAELTSEEFHELMDLIQKLRG